MKNFDAHDIEHIRAWREFTRTCIWPVEQDIQERGEPGWVIRLQSQMAEAWVESQLD